MVQGHSKPEPKDLWQEPFIPASSWKPCADQRSWEPNGLSLFLCFSLSGVSVGVSVRVVHIPSCLSIRKHIFSCKFLFHVFESVR